MALLLSQLRLQHPRVSLLDHLQHPRFLMGPRTPKLSQDRQRC